jgi:hypothetical protein
MTQMDPARNAGDRRLKSLNFGDIAHYVGFVFVGEITWGLRPRLYANACSAGS